MRAFLAVVLVVVGTAVEGAPIPFYDIVAIDGSTNRVTRIAVSRFRRNPYGIEFKRVMLRERKKAKPGEVIKYTFEGSFAPGDVWQGSNANMLEPSPLPLSTPIDPNYQSPPTFGLDGS